MKCFVVVLLLYFSRKERKSLLIYLTLWGFVQDLKDPRRRDELAAARAMLKKNTMMLLTTSKVRVSKVFASVNYFEACPRKIAFCSIDIHEHLRTIS